MVLTGHKAQQFKAVFKEYIEGKLPCIFSNSISTINYLIRSKVFALDAGKEFKECRTNRGT